MKTFFGLAALFFLTGIVVVWNIEFEPDKEAQLELDPAILNEKIYRQKVHIATLEELLKEETSIKNQFDSTDLYMTTGLATKLQKEQKAKEKAESQMIKSAQEKQLNESNLSLKALEYIQKNAVATATGTSLISWRKLNQMDDAAIRALLKTNGASEKVLQSLPAKIPVKNLKALLIGTAAAGGTKLLLDYGSDFPSKQKWILAGLVLGFVFCAWRWLQLVEIVS